MSYSIHDEPHLSNRSQWLRAWVLGANDGPFLPPVYWLVLPPQTRAAKPITDRLVTDCRGFYRWRW